MRQKSTNDNTISLSENVVTEKPYFLLQEFALPSSSSDLPNKGGTN
jgi:hypothetical protein